MSKGILLRLLICIFTFVFFLYMYIDKQNDLTEIKIEIPRLKKEVCRIIEDNKRLRYQIDQFESPEHLLNLSIEPEFSHLKQPLDNQVIQLEEMDLLKGIDQGID